MDWEHSHILIFLSKKTYFPSCVRNMLPYILSTMVWFLNHIRTRGGDGIHHTPDSFFPFSQKIFRRPILKTFWLFRPFCYGCCYDFFLLFNTHSKKWTLTSFYKRNLKKNASWNFFWTYFLESRDPHKDHMKYYFSHMKCCVSK